MATTNHGAIVTPDGGGTVNAVTALAAMSGSIEPGVVGYYADPPARDAGTLALRNAGKKGMRAFVFGSPGPDWCGWNGTEWIWDHPAPLFYEPLTISPSHAAGSGFTNFFALDWPAAQVTFTIARRGWAYVGFDWDLETGAAGGWGAANTAVKLDGVLVPDGDASLWFEQASGTSRAGNRFTPRVPVLVGAGSHTLNIDVWRVNGTGSWRFNTFAWKVAVL